MYDRKLPDPRPVPLPENRFRRRIETLVGITGSRMAKYRDSWHDAVFAILNVAWRPHLLAILLFEAMVFGFGIGINVSRPSTRLQNHELTALSDHQRCLPRYTAATRLRI